MSTVVMASCCERSLAPTSRFQKSHRAIIQSSLSRAHIRAQALHGSFHLAPSVVHSRVLLSSHSTRVIAVCSGW